jgi:hypothetical protein
MAQICDLPDGESEIFLQRGLDRRANQQVGENFSRVPDAASRSQKAMGTYFFAVFFFFAAFFGTFFPSALASDKPIAIACLRLVTFLPERPLFKVPALRFFIARSTLADAFFEYFRAMILLPVTAK